MRRDLGWERGDIVVMEVLDKNAVGLRRYAPPHLPDRIRKAAEKIPTIRYGGKH